MEYRVSYGDRSNGKKENLIVLCPNCHRQEEMEKWARSDNESTLPLQGESESLTLSGSTILMLNTSKSWATTKLDTDLRQLIDAHLTEDTQKLLGISADMRITDILIRMCNHIEHYDPPCQMCAMVESLNNS